MPVFLRRWHGDIPTSPRINLFQRILLIGDGSAAQTTFGCYLFRVAYKLADGRNDAIRQIGVSEVTYYRWRQELGGAAHPVGRPAGTQLPPEQFRIRRYVPATTAQFLVNSLSRATRPFGSFTLLMRYSNSRPLCGSCLVTS